MITIVDGPNLLIRLIATLDVANQSIQERLLDFLYWNGEACHALIFAWEGKDSTKARKKLLESYKENRGTTTTGRSKKDDQFFFDMASEFLEDLNVCQIAVPEIEADDVIAYLCRKSTGQTQVISEDKDFYQLLVNERISLNRPRQRFVYNHDNLAEKEKILPENYLLAKAICGDQSDNVHGLASIKIARLVHYFPELATRPLTVEDLVNYQTEDRFAKKLQERLVDSRDIVERNLRVVTLDTTTLTQVAQSKIEFQLSQRTPRTLSITEFKDILAKHSVRYDPARLSKFYFVFQRLAKARIAL